MRHEPAVLLFPDVLARLRESRKISQKTLAIAAGMDPSYWAGLESGRRPPPRDRQLLRIATALCASEEETAQLFAARAASKIKEIGRQIAPGQRPAMMELLLTAVALTTEELSALTIIAQNLSSLRPNNCAKETDMRT